MASHFFKIILQRSLQDGKLQVPNNFMKKHGGDMPNPVFLKPPDGTVWEIFWRKYDDGEVWFEKGWKEVAEYYCLDHGHLVVFKYDKGPSHIGVNIFDMSATEILYPLRNGDDSDSDSDSDSVEFLYEIPAQKKKETGEAETTSSTQQMMHEVKGNIELKSTKQELEESPKSKAVIIKGKMKPLTCSEKVQALKRVSTFMSKNPYFKIAIQPAYIFNGLCVPARFVEEYLKKKKKEGGVILRVSDGRTWSAMYKIWVNGSKVKCKISKGWIKFSRDNKLKVGDVCVFELTSSINISFLVHIFGGSKNPSC